LFLLFAALSHRGVVGLDMDLSTVLWEKPGGLVSCIQSSGDLIMAGTFSGQLRVISREREFEHRVLINSCSVQSLETHTSGRYLLVGYTCGTVHLFGENFNKVILNLLEVDEAAGDAASCPGVKVVGVKFLPDPCFEHAGLLALAVCYYKQVAYALVDPNTGEVRKKFSNWVAFSPLTSFCQTASDPHVFYVSEGDGDSITSSIWRQEVCFTGTSNAEVPEDALAVLAKYHSVDDGPLLIIAAGRKFLITARMFDIVIFHVDTFKKLATISDFLGK
jgi:hypothetical protein